MRRLSKCAGIQNKQPRDICTLKVKKIYGKRLCTNAITFDVYIIDTWLCTCKLSLGKRYRMPVLNYVAVFYTKIQRVCEGIFVTRLLFTQCKCQWVVALMKWPYLLQHLYVVMALPLVHIKRFSCRELYELKWKWRGICSVNKDLWMLRTDFVDLMQNGIRDITWLGIIFNDMKVDRNSLIVMLLCNILQVPWIRYVFSVVWL